MFVDLEDAGLSTLLIVYANSLIQCLNDKCYIDILKYHTSPALFFTDIDLVLTSSISGRNACPSEEVIFTCTAQGDALFWRNEAFGERPMHYTSALSRGEEFTAEIVSYDRNQNCLVSSLSFRATASRNGTTVTCTSRDRSSSQSLSLHIVSSESVGHYLTESCR